MPKGTITKIISYLNHEGYNAFKLDAIALSYIGYPQSGYIDINKTKLTKLDFLHQLTFAKAKTNKIILIPGETKYFFLRQVANDLNVSLDKLNFFYDKKSPLEDGFIIAQTYEIPKFFSEEQIIDFLINHSKKNHDNICKQFLKPCTKDEYKKVLIIASIIQKEAANTNEMPIVSSVIYNRLKLKMPLQMDGALNYGKFSHDKITSKKIKEDNTSFNTYKYNTIPIYPVCNVSINAIKAAINPKETKYLYFYRDKKTNTHIFEKSYHKHLKNIKKTTK